MSFTGFGDAAPASEGRPLATSALMAGGLPAPASRPSSAAAAMVYFGVSAPEVTFRALGHANNPKPHHLVCGMFGVAFLLCPRPCRDSVSGNAGKFIVPILFGA